MARGGRAGPRAVLAQRPRRRYQLRSCGIARAQVPTAVLRGMGRGARLPLGEQLPSPPRCRDLAAQSSV
eukprot:13471143-Heterocapsa_arctica.AAC.1